VIGAINKVVAELFSGDVGVTMSTSELATRASYLAKGLKSYCHIASRCIAEVSATFSTNFIYRVRDMSANANSRTTRAGEIS
jgi:hypothetical protein